MTGGPQIWTVYRLEFPSDGAQYVGITARTMAERIGSHAAQGKKPGGGNREVSARLRAGEKFYTHVLVRGLTEADARRRELMEIRLLRKPINITGATAPQCARHITGRLDKVDWPIKPDRHRYPRCPEPRPGTYRCSRCREWRDWTEFWRDRTRFNGLDSRCKYCSKLRRSRACPKEGPDDG